MISSTKKTTKAAHTAVALTILGGKKEKDLIRHLTTENTEQPKTQIPLQTPTAFYLLRVFRKEDLTEIYTEQAIT